MGWSDYLCRQTHCSGAALSGLFPHLADCAALAGEGCGIGVPAACGGISSAGEKELDALLPLPEYYQIPQATAEAVNRALQEKRRVIAIGTSVTRALESAAKADNRVQPGEGIARLLLKPSYKRKIVSGILTGMHENSTSHFQLLQSFASRQLLEKAYAGAKKRGYLWHEFGDSCLIS